MAFLRNSDGTYTVTDLDGNLVSESVPAEYVPPEIVARGANGSALYNAPPSAPVPPQERLAVEDDLSFSNLTGLNANELLGGGGASGQSGPPANSSGGAPSVPDIPPAPYSGGGGTLGDPDAQADFSSGGSTVPNTNEPVPTPGLVESAPGPLASIPPPTAPPPTTAGQIGAATGKDPASALFGVDIAARLQGRDVYSAPQKARDVLQGFSVERQASLTPEAKLGQALAYQNAIDTARANAAGLSAVLSEQALTYEKQRDAAQGELDSIKKREAERDAALRPRMREFDRNAELIRTFRVNPDIYWEKKGAVGTVLAKIGIALGALGSAVTGGPNQVYQQVRAEVEDEINAQQTTLAAMKAGQEANVNALAQMRQLYISPEAAEIATRALLSETVASEARRLAAEMGSQEAIANGETLAAKFSLDAANDRARVEQLEGGAIRETYKHRPATPGGKVHIGPSGPSESAALIIGLGKQYGLAPKDAINLAAQPNSPFPLSNEERKTAVVMKQDALSRQVRDPETGETLYASDKEAKTKAQAGLNAFSEFIKNLTEIEDIYRKSPGGVSSGLNPKARGRVETLVAKNTFLAQQAIVQNALQAHEELRAAPITGQSALQVMNRVNEAEQWATAKRLLKGNMEQLRSNLMKDPYGESGYAAPASSGNAPSPIALPPGATPRK